jgi:hypothetical protein
MIGARLMRSPRSPQRFGTFDPLARIRQLA